MTYKIYIFKNLCHSAFSTILCSLFKKGNRLTFLPHDINNFHSYYIIEKVSEVEQSKKAPKYTQAYKI